MEVGCRLGILQVSLLKYGSIVVIWKSPIFGKFGFEMKSATVSSPDTNVSRQTWALHS